MPPVNLLLVALAGFALRRTRAGRMLCGFGLAGLLVLALPVTGNLLLVSVERLPARADPPPPEAIVILSGDINRVVGTPGGQDVGALTLERLRAGSVAWRATHLPVLVTGGIIGDEGTPLAVLMARSLETDFAVPTRWQETDSQDTWGNAERSAAILKTAGIRSVILVTHAWHMRRALIAFDHFGIAAIPEPVPPRPLPKLQPGAFIPRATAWTLSYDAMHEWIGCAWYALRAHRATAVPTS